LGNKRFAVIDGREEEYRDGIGATIVFSPNSRRFAYVAQKDNKYSVVIDGQEGKQFDAIGNGSIIFSPDSNHVVYCAQTDNKRFVVINGKEEKKYDDVGNKSLVFSPDSKYLAYMAQSDNKHFVVFGAEKQNFYDNILNLTMGGIVFDSSDRFHYLAIRDKSVYLVEGRVGGELSETVGKR